jgi:hypothetical protein
MLFRYASLTIADEALMSAPHSQSDASMKLFQRLLLALTIMVSVVSPSMAESVTGSHGWALQPLSLRDGPGAAYAVTGNIAENAAIKVLRCQKVWCLVDGPGGRGWTSLERVGFGLSPEGPLFAIQPNYPAGGPGSACFYTGTNYSGSSFCAGPGEVFPDLALHGVDNSFASVKISGNVSAAACRERKFHSYCERIVESQLVLDRYLNRNLSSIRVY